MNISLAYLVYNRVRPSSRRTRSEKRLAQTREFRVVLSGIRVHVDLRPRLSHCCRCRLGWGADALHERVAAALSEHGLMLDVEWNLSGGFASSATRSIHRLFMAARPASSFGDEAVAADSGEPTPQGQIVCAETCVRLVTVPLLQYGKDRRLSRSGQRSIADSLRRFTSCPGAEFLQCFAIWTCAQAMAVVAWQSGVRTSRQSRTRAVCSPPWLN